MCLGIPGQVVAPANEAAHQAAVLVTGTRRMVDLSLIWDEGVALGDWVVVHAGFALGRLSEQEASETLALLQELSAANAQDAQDVQGALNMKSDISDAVPGITDTRTAHA